MCAHSVHLFRQLLLLIDFCPSTLSATAVARKEQQREAEQVCVPSTKYCILVQPAVAARANEQKNVVRLRKWNSKYERR